jgi:hypothetical protein
MRIIVGLSLVGLLLLAAVAAFAGGSGTAVGPQPVNVAFVGDQGLGSSSVAVLQLIEDEGADIALIQGDFDYADDPDAWDAQTTSVLGATFPVLASVGNHDVCCVAAYAAKVAARLAANPEIACSVADTVISKAHCTFRGLSIAIVGAGTTGSGDSVYAPYIESEFSGDTHTWRICSWHKNQRLMQVGDKPDESGWGVYEQCRQAGAFVATGHEHSYSRTHLMSSFQNQTVASTSSTLELSEGESFAFVSGMGGRSIRPQLLSGPWWASIYTSTQGANYGALFCTFFDTAENHASCYFKDIDGEVPDQFEIVTRVNEPPPDADTDGDGTLDVVEIACGSDRLAAGSVPERIDLAGDDDGDTQVDEGLPAGGGAYDCDGDGFTGAAEGHVFGRAPGDHTPDQDPCGTNLSPPTDPPSAVGWPLDLHPGDQVLPSANAATAADFVSFLAPVRYLDSNVGDLPGSVRWDLIPGAGTLGTDINAQDMNALLGGDTAVPPMLNGLRGLDGPPCPWPP